MDKHTLSEILKILPDDFTFKAVLDEDSQSICFETQDKPHNMKQEAEEQELWEDMCDTEMWWWDYGDYYGDEYPQYYDTESKRWIDYTTYWSNRIKTELEFKGIFMGDAEFESLIHLSHPLIVSLNCEWWRDYPPVLSLCDLYFELDDFIDKYATYEKAPDDFEGCTLTCSPYPQDK
ncbi:hypothetical protein [Helicobacter cinaedi]|uniref:hypothetical protein n=1 Tax=Helicobacter cinaedi TaxID=213 RepID=UPI001E539FBD|nr:hypothetical protein [Helicobacter cinaedi]